MLSLLLKGLDYMLDYVVVPMTSQDRAVTAKEVENCLTVRLHSYFFHVLAKPLPIT